MAASYSDDTRALSEELNALGGGNVSLEPAKVIVRVRAPLKQEPSIVVCHDSHQLEVADPRQGPAPASQSRTRQFDFYSVMPSRATQEEVYEQYSSALLENIQRGFDVLTLALGPMGCGKTHTIMGNPSLGAGDEWDGVIPRLIDDLFEFSSVIDMAAVEIGAHSNHDVLKDATVEGPEAGLCVRCSEPMDAFRVLRIMLRSSRSWCKNDKGDAEEPSPNRAHTVLRFIVHGQGAPVNLWVVDTVGSMPLVPSRASASSLPDEERRVLSQHVFELGRALANPDQPARGNALSKFVMEQATGRCALVGLVCTPSGMSAHLDILATLGTATKLQKIEGKCSSGHEMTGVQAQEAAQFLKAHALMNAKNGTKPPQLGSSGPVKLEKEGPKDDSSNYDDETFESDHGNSPTRRSQGSDSEGESGGANDTPVFYASDILGRMSRSQSAERGEGAAFTGQAQLNSSNGTGSWAQYGEEEEQERRASRSLSPGGIDAMSTKERDALARMRALDVVQTTASSPGGRSEDHQGNGSMNAFARSQKEDPDDGNRSPAAMRDEFYKLLQRMDAVSDGVPTPDSKNSHPRTRGDLGELSPSSGGKRRVAWADKQSDENVNGIVQDCDSLGMALRVEGTDETDSLEGGSPVHHAHAIPEGHDMGINNEDVFKGTYLAASTDDRDKNNSSNRTRKSGYRESESGRLAMTSEKAQFREELLSSELLDRNHDSLLQMLRTSETECADLKETVKDLQNAVEEKEAQHSLELETCRSEILELKAKLRLANKSNGVEDLFDRYEGEIDRLHAAVAKAEARAITAQTYPADSASVDSTVNMLRKTVKAQHKDIEALRKENHQFSKMEKVMLRSKKLVEEQSRRTLSLKKELDSQKTTIAQKDHQLGEISQLVTDQAKQLDVLTEERDGLKHRCNGLSMHCSELQKQLEDAATKNRYGISLDSSTNVANGDSVVVGSPTKKGAMSAAASSVLQSLSSPTKAKNRKLIADDVLSRLEREVGNSNPKALQGIRKLQDIIQKFDHDILVGEAQKQEMLVSLIEIKQAQKRKTAVESQISKPNPPASSKAGNRSSMSGAKSSTTPASPASSRHMSASHGNSRPFSTSNRRRNL